MRRMMGMKRVADCGNTRLRQKRKQTAFFVKKSIYSCALISDDDRRVIENKYYELRDGKKFYKPTKRQFIAIMIQHTF